MANNNNIHPTAIVYPNVKLGTGITIGAYAVIGGPPEHKEFWSKPYHSVVVGDGCYISNHVTVDSGTTADTFIGNRCILLAKCHVGHDAILEDDVTISVGAVVGGHTTIGQYSNIGINAALHQLTHVPKGVMVGMGCIVTKKTFLDSFSIYAGVPAKFIGINKVLLERNKDL